jgi:hypothetical protein
VDVRHGPDSAAAISGDACGTEPSGAISAGDASQPDT